jgi:hypothetical protein
LTQSHSSSIRRNGRKASGSRRGRHRFHPEVDLLEARRLLTSAVFADGFGSGAANKVTIESVAIDASGNEDIAGSFTGTVSLGSWSLTALSRTNLFIAQIGPRGNVLWAVAMTSTEDLGDQTANGIATDPEGNIYVTGNISSPTNFGDTMLTPAGMDEIYLAKLDPDGNFVYASGFDGTGSSVGTGVAVDPAGNAYITGLFTNTITFGSTTLSMDSGATDDGYVVKIEPTGSAVWATGFTGPNQVSPSSVAVSAAGQVDVTGTLFGAGQFGGISLMGPDGNVFVTQLNGTDGTVNWAVSQGGPQDTESGVSVAVDASDEIAVTGRFSNVAYFGSIRLETTSQTSVVFFEKMDPAGNVQWAKAIDVPIESHVDVSGIAFDTSGDLYLTGYIQGSANFGTTSLTSNKGANATVYLAKYDTSGTELGAIPFGASGNNVPRAIALGGPNSDLTIVGAYGGQFAVYNDGLSSTGSGFVIRLSRLAPKAGAEPLSNFSKLGYSQISVYRSSTHQWFTVTPTANVLLGTFGKSGDIPAAGDYLGLGHSQLAVYRPSTQQWIDSSATSNGGVLGVFGSSTDIPVPGDYFGLGHTELAVFRPSTDQWFVDGPTGSFLLGKFGGPGDIPVPGDYFGTGKTEMAVFRPSTDQWFVAGPRGNVLYTTFGGPGDVPTPGDFDAVGHTEVAVFRPSTAQWFVQGTAGGRLVNTFGAVNYVDIPTETSAGSLKQRGLFMAAIGSGFHPSATLPIGMPLGPDSIVGTGSCAKGDRVSSAASVVKIPLTPDATTPVVTYIVPSDLLAHDAVWSKAIDGLDD